ncbi:MAG: hypothetical protein JST54_04280 [Deltaproteobacteria bacterium]|nr:hypothetical protein [Deltaproteobacteria bacterium]
MSTQRLLFAACCALFTLSASTALVGCGQSCGPGNCAGCCDANGACQGASPQTCGQNGAACVTCLSFQSCFEGACFSPGGSGNGNSSGGNSTNGTSATGSGTTTGQGTATQGSTSNGTTTTSSTTSNGSGTTTASSTTTSNTSNTSSTSTSTTGTSGSNSPPQIESLTANPTTIGPGGSTVISAIVSDPDGLSDLAGGTLAAPSGSGTYGAFSTPGGQGTFTFTLSWSELQSVSAFEIPAGGKSISVSATFFDNHGHSTTQTLNLTAACSPSGDATCSGSCTDLQTDPNNCGSCGNVVASGGSCVNGSPGCPHSYDVVCNGACVDAKFDSSNCGSCGNDCSTWAMNHGLSASQATCDYGVCALQATGVINESCASYCASQGTGLTCYLDAKCENADGSYTGYVNAGCAIYSDTTTGGICTAQVALSCNDAPPATEPSCNTGSTDPGTLSYADCLCTG